MKFELNCMAADLRQALAIASTVTDSGVKTPVLKATRIEVFGKTATFIATNLDHAIRVSVGAEGEGIVHLETALLAQKANLLRQNEPVRMAGDDQFVTVTQGKTRWRLPIIIGDGFPFEFTSPVVGDVVKIDRAPLMSAMSACGEIINPTDPHPTISKGVYLDMSDGFRVVGAARRGLSVIEINQPTLPMSIIVPSSTVRTMSQIFRDDETLSVVATENAICVMAGQVMYKSKLIEGKYADWRGAMMAQVKGLASSSVLYSENFTESLSRATAIAEDKTKSGSSDGVRVTFAGGECSMLIHNKNGEEGFDTCDCEGDDGYFTIGAGLVSAAFNTMPGQKLRVSFDPDPDPSNPSAIMIKTEPASDRDNYRIVMGMIVQ